MELSHPLGQVADRQDRQQRGVFQDRDEFIPHRRDHDPEGLWQDDLAGGLPTAKPKASRRFNLASRDGVDPGAENLGDIGRVCDGHGHDPAQKVRRVEEASGRGFEDAGKRQTDIEDDDQHRNAAERVDQEFGRDGQGMALIKEAAGGQKRKRDAQNKSRGCQIGICIGKHVRLPEDQVRGCQRRGDDGAGKLAGPDQGDRLLRGDHGAQLHIAQCRARVGAVAHCINNLRGGSGGDAYGTLGRADERQRQTRLQRLPCGKRKGRDGKKRKDGKRPSARPELHQTDPDKSQHRCEHIGGDPRPDRDRKAHGKAEVGEEKNPGKACPVEGKQHAPGDAAGHLPGREAQGQQDGIGEGQRGCDQGRGMRHGGSGRFRQAARRFALHDKRRGCRVDGIGKCRGKEGLTQTGQAEQKTCTEGADGQGKRGFAGRQAGGDRTAKKDQDKDEPRKQRGRSRLYPDDGRKRAAVVAGGGEEPDQEWQSQKQDEICGTQAVEPEQELHRQISVIGHSRSGREAIFLPDDKVRSNQVGQAFRVFAVEKAKNEGGQHPAQAFQRIEKSCERRPEIGAGIDVVIGDDRGVTANPQSAFMKAGQDAQGGGFVDADEAGRRIGSGAQGQRNGFAVAGGEIAIRQKRRVYGKSGLGQGAAVTVDPVDGIGKVRLGIYQADAAVSARDQPGGGSIGRPFAVNVHEGMRAGAVTATQGDKGETAVDQEGDARVIGQDAGKDQPIGMMALHDAADGVDAVLGVAHKMDGDPVGRTLQLFGNAGQNLGMLHPVPFVALGHRKGHQDRDLV